MDLLADALCLPEDDVALLAVRFARAHPAAEGPGQSSSQLTEGLKSANLPLGLCFQIQAWSS